jgi:anti-sigma regulatory factor (Ser/Thr protein kinase)
VTLAASGTAAALGGEHVADDHRSDGLVPGLDQAFDSSALHILRAEVLAQACRAGLTASRAGDVVLAVHELAANAIRHGAGAGRLRIWKLAQALRCQVDDGDPSSSGRLVGEANRTDVPGGTDVPGQGPEKPWLSLPGHGLWVVRQVADQMRIVTSPRGTRATIVFDLP